MSTCYHCNDTCQEEIIYDHHTFCCVGCKTVYEILNGNALDGFYNLEEKPGIKPGNKAKGQYDYLDVDTFKEKLVFFEEGEISRIRFFLPQIHCSSCLWLLERLHKMAHGVMHSQVDFVKKEVVITYNSTEISLREVAELCATIGYPPKITLEDYGEKRKNSTNRRLILQIGVAGFCFGNIMLISFPEYLGINENDANFQRLFNALNLLLALPVLLFGARDYLVSAFKAVRIKTINIDVPISLGILALFLRSVYEITSGEGAGYMDSFAGLIFFLLVGKWFQHQTYTAINFERDYESYFPISVARKKEDGEEIIPLKSVQIGDRLVIRNNELIPTDSVLISGGGNIDYSFVSGESALIRKREGDRLYAGGRQEGKTIEIEVVKEVENSYLTQLWNNPVFTTEKKRVSLADKVSKYFTWAVLFIAVVAGGVWLYIDAGRAAFVVTSILIVACPCAIALSVPFTYGNAIRILGRHGFYMRSTTVIEPLNEITTVVFDKTGTLTENTSTQLDWEGEELTPINTGVIWNMVRHSSHPLSRKIGEQCKKMNVNLTDDKVNELNEASGKGIEAIVDGKIWKIGSADWTGTSKPDNRTRVYVKRGDEVIGNFVFANQYREGIEKLFQQLAPAKKIHVLSGDNDAEKTVLSKMTPDGTQLVFNQKPEDKLAYIAQLQEKGEKVMMLGDGLNDAGALKQSDIGISVVDDVYAFSPASDVIISGKELTRLEAFLGFTAYSTRVVKWSYVFSSVYNTIGLCFALAGALTPLVAAILMPLSSISVVLFVTLMTNLKKIV